MSQSYNNWNMVICDDGSDIPIQSVLSSMQISDSRITIKRMNDSLEHKEQFGSNSGRMLNEAMAESDSDISIILCDDDGLYPDYLLNLNMFYSNHPEIMYSYGHVSLYDPQSITDIKDIPQVNLDTFLNKTLSINPVCAIDASQVSWRLNDLTNDLFPFPQTAALDAVVFQKLYDLYGNCVYNNIIAQYKGWFLDQLGNRMYFGFGLDPLVK